MSSCIVSSEQILKKRRSRSVSPGATAAQPTPKATRRISFSTKNAVRYVSFVQNNLLTPTPDGSINENLRLG